jgi:hypothetical protein
MNRLLFALSIVLLAFAMMGCARESSQEATATGAEVAPPAASRDAAAAAPKSVEPKPAAAAAPAKAAVPRMFEIPEGTVIAVFLTDPISTAKNKAGDTFTASLADPIVVNGQTVADRGATVKGRVIDAEGSGRVKGTANIRLALTSIVAGEKSYPIVTRPYVAEAESTKGRDAGIIAGGGGVGAAIGALAGGKKGAVKGAVIGGAAGTGAVLATKGKEVEFGSETKLTFALEKTAELPRIH